MLSSLFNRKQNSIKKRLGRLVPQILKKYETQVALKSDADIKQSHQRLAALIKLKGPSTAIQVEAFAIVYAAIIRALDKSPYPSQLLTALVMGEGHLAELATGEGKTLVIPFVAYWRMINGEKVHISTANDFLAQRDALALEAVYAALGVSVAVRIAGQEDEVRRQVYLRDVVYSTHGGLASDFLRDNLQRRQEDIWQQRDKVALILDEADISMIDEARMPVALFNPISANKQVLEAIASEIVPSLNKECFELDAVRKIAHLTEEGEERSTEMLVALGLLGQEQANYQAKHYRLLQRIQFALSAQHGFSKDTDYAVLEGEELVAIDSETGRLNRARTWSAEVTQALEAKEQLSISPDRQLMGKISLQAFFNSYPFLTGTSGTLKTEQEEFLAVYGKEVVEMEPNTPSLRIDFTDRFFHTQEQKITALLEDLKKRHAQGQPILVGTSSDEQSELLASLLEEEGIEFSLLNAQNNEKEARILANAGKKGAVTISTNMAGRGVDIQLGGNPSVLAVEFLIDKYGKEDLNEKVSDTQWEKTVEDFEKQCNANAKLVRQLGGLHVIGMQRYDSERKDFQLRGRAARQGDPGSSQFFLALDDPLLKAYASERIEKMTNRLDLSEDEEVLSALARSFTRQAQRRASAQNSSLRQALIESESVIDAQRVAYYNFRKTLLQEGLEGRLEYVWDKWTLGLIQSHGICLTDFSHEWDWDGLLETLGKLNLAVDVKEMEAIRETETFAGERVLEKVNEALAARLGELQAKFSTSDHFLRFQAFYALAELDSAWFGLLDHMEEMAKSVHLRVHAKEKPDQALSKEAGIAFKALIESGCFNAGHRVLQELQVFSPESPIPKQ